MFMLMQFFKDFPEKNLLRVLWFFKGIVRPKMKILSLITHPHWFQTMDMDYFHDVLTTFLGLDRVSCIAVYAGSESSRISSKIS